MYISILNNEIMKLVGGQTINRGQWKNFLKYELILHDDWERLRC